MLDLDHFKKFNDTFGHEAGDALLRAVSDCVQRNTRSSDVACRFGGEELLLIMPESPLDDTLRRAEQLRDEIRDLHVSYSGQLLGSVSASLGIAAFPEHGQSSEELLASADRALYAAKAGGRDRCSVALDPGSES